MVTKALLMFSTVCTTVYSYGSYRNYVPNAENVIVDGVQWVGLGHPSATAGSDQGNPNVFGIQVRDAHAEFGRDAEAIWASICESDPDGDGLSNKVELCDPDCNSPGLNPECPEGTVPTHPAYPNIDETTVGAETKNSIPAAYIWHGIFMMLAWVFVAPYGILKVVIYKKRKSKVKPPIWFVHHKRSMIAVAVLHVIGVLIMAVYVGVEPLQEVFGDLGVHRESRQGRHIIMGFTVTLFVLLQMISGKKRAKVRPGERKSRIRAAWEFQHQYLGRLMMVLSFICVYTGLDLVYDNGIVGSVLLAIVFTFVGSAAIVYAVVFREEFDEKYAQALDEAEDKVEDINVEEGTTRAKSVYSAVKNKHEIGSKHSQNPMFEDEA